MPSAAPAVLLRSPPRFTTLGDVAAQMTRRDVGMLCNFTLRLRHGREIAQPYRFWGLLGFPSRSGGLDTVLRFRNPGQTRITARQIIARAQ
jgi:hypothetical protein